MKLINKLITKTAIYKHLKDLYEQALRDAEILQENARKDCKDIQELQKMLGEAESDNIKYFKIIKKIRARVNKLDKKDENVKEIKRLIKEVL